MAVNKGEFYRLIDQIDDPIDLETAYAAVKSIVEHDDQSWYWTEEWQEGEREADADKAARRVSRAYDSAEDMMRDLFGNNEDHGTP